MTDPSFIRACEPPWIVFPSIKPEELSSHLTQGEAEPWFDAYWRPFWSGLTPDQKTQYLDHWQATAAWREALRFFFDAADALDLEEDARESEAYLARWRNEKRKT